MPRPRRTRGDTAVSAAPSITAFTRVSKGVAVELPGKKYKLVGGDDYIQVQSSSKKRKALDQDAVVVVSAAVKSRGNVKRACIRVAEEDQENKDPVVECVVVADAKPAAKLFQNITAVAASPADTKKISSSTKKKAGNGTNANARRVAKSSRKPASTINNARIDDLFEKARRAADAKEEAQLPAHLADLAKLHKAFLKTITVHFAHNGINTPVDVRSIAPSIAQAWGKRAVTVEDIRRCIAMQGHGEESTSPFVISDYGRGKICIEVAPENAGKAINEVKLCQQFEANLHSLCAKRAHTQAIDEMADDGMEISLEGLSLADLPQAPIADLAHDPRSNPILAKGHRALAELKNGLAARVQERERKEEFSSTTNPDGSKMSLLDRIRMKQLVRSQLPHPPSGPELERRAALQRVEDVAATLSMLSLVNPVPRLAFTMPVLVQKLRDSLRIPVSKEDCAACVRLMTEEVTPEWIKILKIGGKENVVIQRVFQPVDRVIKERVAGLLQA